MQNCRLTPIAPLLIAALLSGCASSSSTRLTEIDDATGSLVATEQATSGGLHERVERFTNGRIRAEDWTSGDTRVRLEFYESGELKSEERFTKALINFARYYSVAGALEHEIGELPSPARRN